MYFWTCWYTKRYRLIIYLALAVALVILGTLPAGMENHGGHWTFPKIVTPGHVRIIWEEGVDHTVGILLLFMLFAAADLGALAMGEDAKRRDIDFLLTRPRPRRYFVWTSWLAGITELVPLMLIPVLTSVLVMFLMSHAVSPGPLLTRCAEIFALAAAMYALAFVLSVLTRSAQSGFQLAAFVIVVYAGIFYARGEVWFLYSWPPYRYYGAFALFDLPSQGFRFANLVCMVMATLALPLIADLSFRRRDL